MRKIPSQREIEALYSKKSIHTVLHNAIRYQLDKVLLNWALMVFIRIGEYLEGTYYASKNRRIGCLKKHIEKHGLDAIVVAICASALHTHTRQSLQQCVGYLQAFLPHDDPFERAITAGELLALGSSDTGLFTIQRNGMGNLSTIEVHHWPFLDQVFMDKFEWINDTCFNPPMLEPPKKVKDNHHCGYLSLNEPLILGDHTQHDHKQNYAVINILNQIEWVLDPDVMAEPEVPSKPLDTPEKHEQFYTMVNSSQFIYDLIDKQPFWLCWQYDSRGRIYSHGYHINFQAAEYKKASLSFNKWEYLT